MPQHFINTRIEFLDQIQDPFQNESLKCFFLCVLLNCSSEKHTAITFITGHLVLQKLICNILSISLKLVVYFLSDGMHIPGPRNENACS